MNLLKITDIKQLEVGQHIAITSHHQGIIGPNPNVNLTIGMVIETDGYSALILSGNNKLLLTNITTKLQAVYVIDKLMLNNTKESMENEISLERKLRKAEKLNRRYKAILTQRFNVTEEELKTNFKKAKKTSNGKGFENYKVNVGSIPCVINGQVKNLTSAIRYKRNKKNHIMCEITVYNNDKSDVICVAQGIAICHEDDTFDQHIGEIIASNKAMKKITSILY